MTWDDLDARIIERLSGDLGDSLYPFRDMAAELGISENELLGRTRAYLECGAMRRFGAILRHQQAGYVANGMSVWNVPDEEIERIGALLADSSQVSHCYQRPRLPDWPYNLYAMIHGKTRHECVAVCERIARETGVQECRVLFSVREFKKSSMEYKDAAVRRRLRAPPEPGS